MEGDLFTDGQLPALLNGDFILRRGINDKALTNVPHHVTHHSPTGYEWGYGGSGPADLALNVLETTLLELDYKGPRTKCWHGNCFQLAWDLHQKFKWDFIANALHDGKVIPWQTVKDWIIDQCGGSLGEVY